MLRFLLLFSTALISFLACAQNAYLPAAEIDTVGLWVRVDNDTLFPAGTPLFIHQFGGAETALEGEATGTVTELNGAGRYLLTQLMMQRGDTLFLADTLPVGLNAASTQVVTAPVTTTYSVTEALTAEQAFDGRSGGILFLTATDSLLIAADLSANAAGFQGANGVDVASECSPITIAFQETYPVGNWRGSPRGAGIAEVSENQAWGRAPLANGGGGGNDHNTGGGGGGAAGAGGGGGINVVDGIFSGACRGFFPGRGGVELSNAQNRLFFGGGGGAGHANNTDEARGGNGGGLIVLAAPTIVFTESVRLTATGSPAPEIDGDGAGGGGGGGTVFIQAAQTTGTPIINVSGGNGGNTINSSNRCFGPGGGGGGGSLIRRVTNETAFSPVIITDGGTPGRRLNSGICSENEEPAEAGGAGLSVNLTPGEPAVARITTSTTFGCSPLNVQLSGEGSTGTFEDYSWRMPGGFPNRSDSINPVVSYRVPGTYQAFLTLTGALGEDNTDTITIEAIAPPVASFVATVEGRTVSLLQESNDSTDYLWDFGDGTTSTDIDPTHTYRENDTLEYTITLTASNGICPRQDSVMVTLDILDNIVDLIELGVTVFPNPSNGRLFLRGQAQFGAVYDIHGRLLVEAADNTRALSLGSLTTGLYVVTVLVDGQHYPVRILRE